MAELVDARDSKSRIARCEGSSPSRGTTLKFMNTIAIDIALIPNDDSIDRLLQINKALQEQHGSVTHPLHPQTCLPHMTLNMCGIDERELPNVHQYLQAAFASMPKLHCTMRLRAKQFANTTDLISQFVLLDDDKATEDYTYKLHEIALNSTAGKEQTAIELSAYVPSNDLTLLPTSMWTKSFREKSSQQNYWAHVTMNLGELPEETKIDLTFNKIALCQLGNYCTCRKVLYEYPLV